MVYLCCMSIILGFKHQGLSNIQMFIAVFIPNMILQNGYGHEGMNLIHCQSTQ